MFLAPWSWWASLRTYRVCMLFERMAARYGVLFIGVFRQRGEQPFTDELSMYFWLDGADPSSAAYRACYEHLRKRHA